MDELLVPIRTTPARLNSKQDVHDNIIHEKDRESSAQPAEGIESPVQALDILKSQPSQEALFNVLRWLQTSKGSQDGFDINGQTPQAAKIIHAVLNDVLPNHWNSIRNGMSKTIRKLRNLVRCSLSNVAGISGIVTRMRSLIGQKDKEGNKDQVQLTGRARQLEEALSILETVLEPDSFVLSSWSELTAFFPSAAKRALVWKELVTLLADGRVLSVASEADDIVTREASTARERSWLSDRSQFSTWIGRNLNHFLSKSKEISIDTEKAWAQMSERALTIGYVGKNDLSLTCNISLLEDRPSGRSSLWSSFAGR